MVCMLSAQVIKIQLAQLYFLEAAQQRHVLGNSLNPPLHPFEGCLSVNLGSLGRS